MFNSQKHLSWGGVGRLTILPRGVRAGEAGKDLVPRNEAVAPGGQQLKAGHAAMAKAVGREGTASKSCKQGHRSSSKGAPHTVSVRVYYIRTDQVHT